MICSPQGALSCTNFVILIRNGGYFHVLLLEELDVYGRPLGNPETGLEERFMSFVVTILNKIDSRWNII